MRFIAVIKLLNIEKIDIILTDKCNDYLIINKDNYNILNTYKNKIDKDVTNKKWDYSKKLSNKYELIHICSSKNNINNNISNYKPLSRSYYKLWEMLHNIKNEIVFEENIKISTIAEGPGGFMEALVHFRKKYYSNYTDDIYGITLKSTNKDIPGWKESNIFKNVSIHISYGKDDTGNLYNYENIIDFSYHTGINSCHIVTADGGFDFSKDFNRQEETAYRLILCEIVTALTIQKKGGLFICKFFDLYTLPTIKLLYLLNTLYSHIYFVKPSMSRPGNSEKYIICMEYKGIDNNYLCKLLSVIKYWGNIEATRTITDIFSNFNLDQNYLDLIKKYNNYISKKQIKNLLKTFQIIGNNFNYDNIKSEQISTAVKWCKKYDVEINNSSKYLQ